VIARSRRHRAIAFGDSKLVAFRSLDDSALLTRVRHG